MKAKKRPTAASPEQETSETIVLDKAKPAVPKARKKAATPRKKAAAPAPRKPRSRRPAAVSTPETVTVVDAVDAAKPAVATARAQETPSQEEKPKPAAKSRPAKFYLTREGVAFGPYTEFQVRESLRLEIFEGRDLALADDATEWQEVSALLPTLEASRPVPSGQPPSVSAEAGGDRGDWQEVSDWLPVLHLPTVPRAEKRMERCPAAPLSEFLLREHETHFADDPTPSFITELMRGKLAFAAVPVVVVLLGLLSMAAVFKHREPSARATAVPRAVQPAPAAPLTAKINPPLTPVSLPVGQTLASREAAAAPNAMSGPGR